MIQIGILGYFGRMGQLIALEAESDYRYEISSAFVRDKKQISQVFMTNSWEQFLSQSDVVIDFSSPEGTRVLLENIEKNPKPLVIGTTGLDREIFLKMQKLSSQVPIVYATNTSQGITLLNQIVSLVAKSLSDADIEIVEIHHHNKKDSPSGTAMTLAQECAEARGLSLKNIRVSGRDGNIGSRTKEEIGVMSLRGGDIIGRHTVGFYCDGEYLELTHNATNRKTFARGALRATSWVAGKTKGFYSMKDVLA